MPIEKRTIRDLLDHLDLYIKDDIADLREFGRQINEFLKKQTSD